MQAGRGCMYSATILLIGSDSDWRGGGREIREGREGTDI